MAPDEGEVDKGDISFGGGKGDQANVEWDYNQEQYGNGWFDLIDYDETEWITIPEGNKRSKQNNSPSHSGCPGFRPSNNSPPCPQIDKNDLGHILNIKGEWEKLTFTGDSGAVDHVITKDAANAFELRETSASKAGLSYRAANGSPI